MQLPKGTEERKIVGLWCYMLLGEEETRSQTGGLCATAVCFFFWLHLHLEACGILVSRPGIEPTRPALEAWRLTRWTPREVPAASAFCTGLGVVHLVACVIKRHIGQTLKFCLLS